MPDPRQIFDKKQVSLIAENVHFGGIFAKIREIII